MTAFITWGAATLLGSAALMLLVLLVRSPVRQLVGTRLAYALWALPALRMLLPSLPVPLAGLPMVGIAQPAMSVLFAGRRGAAPAPDDPSFATFAAALLVVWLIGAIALFATYALRHWRFCRRLRSQGSTFATASTITILVTDVEAPLAFGVLRRFIAVPLHFARGYTAAEQGLAIAHETAHHQRGDLIANWISLVVLAAHWWNPLAWAAIRAFREDQEFAADARVVAAQGPGARRLYAQVLAKAAGYGALPACNLGAHSNLKGRLIMLGQTPRSHRQLIIGSAALILAGGTALAATLPPAGKPGIGSQAVTISVKPDGSGGYTLITGPMLTARAALPAEPTLPADFTPPAGCDLEPTAKPFAMVIKGEGKVQTYTVMCASAAPAPIGATLAEGITSLKTMRSSVASQPASTAFPETERTHALAAIDASIRDVEAALASRR